jgi:hypothetical protein
LSGRGVGLQHLQAENEIGERVARNREFQIAERRLPPFADGVIVEKPSAKSRLESEVN